MEVCFTQRDKHLVGGKVWPNEPTDTVWARCSGNRGSGGFWDSKPCRVTSKLTLKKDGVEAWTEDRAFNVAADSGGNTYVDFYACRGNGVYSLTLHDIHVEVYDNDASNVDIDVAPFTVTASGC